MKNCGHKKADHPAGSWRSDKIPAASHLLNRTGGHPRIHHHSAFVALLLRASWGVAVRRRLADLDLCDLPTRLRPDHREPVRPRGTAAAAGPQPDRHTDRLSDPFASYGALVDLSLAGHRRIDSRKSFAGPGLYRRC